MAPRAWKISVNNWRDHFKSQGLEWAIDAAEQLFMTDIDNKRLDLQTVGFDATTAASVFEALEWLHAEKDLPIPE